MASAEKMAATVAERRGVAVLGREAGLDIVRRGLTTTDMPVGSMARSSRKPIIIGEDMERVNAYARLEKVGGETIADWLAGRRWTQELNDDFIDAMKSQCRRFDDIGPAFDRRLVNKLHPSEGRPASRVYGSERKSLLNYSDYQRLYMRTGKYNVN